MSDFRAMAGNRIGYFLPEFPGQTHTFFWRELRVLDGSGLEVDVVSSRPPGSAIAKHDWTEEAIRRTTYLHPPRNIIRTVLHGAMHPDGLLRCLVAVAMADRKSIVDRLKMVALIFYAVELSRLAKARGWIHLHCHSCGESANVTMLANRFSGLRFSLTLHSQLSAFGLNHRQKWSRAQFGIVITQKLDKEIRRELGSDCPARIEIVPMGVDTGEFSRRAPYRPREGDGPLRIVSCGRLNPCKGHADTIAAVSKLVHQGVDARLVIAGEDEEGGCGYRRELEQQIDQFGLSDRIQLLGAVPEIRVRQELEAAHVFVLASLSEPFGVAIAEAMSMGMPVIATDAGGVPELVTHGYDGLLVPPHSSDAIVHALLALIGDPDHCRLLGMNARSTVATRFGVQRSAKVLLNTIRVDLEVSSSLPSEPGPFPEK